MKDTLKVGDPVVVTDSAGWESEGILVGVSQWKYLVDTQSSEHGCIWIKKNQVKKQVEQSE